MGDLGEVLLAAVFLLCSFATVFALAALKLQIEPAKKVFLWARRAMLTAVGLAVVTLVLLMVAFLTDDFSIAVVGQYSSAGLDFFYKLSAVWAGSAGSLLLWSVTMFVLFGLWLARTDSDELKFNTIALSIGAGVCLGFSALLIFVAKPFASSPVIIDDGIGLNLSLQNLWMIIHPPLLFVGYSAFLIPFVIVLAAVLAGTVGNPEFYRQLRCWLLAGICFLSLGIATGARWSYLEMGWGGYWAWDPVENASLLPWLVAVAALHGLAGIRLANRFRLWTVVLAPVPFILCLFATFITRSGLLASVHSFDRNVMFSALLAFIGCCLLLWVACIIKAAKNISTSPSWLSASGSGKGKLLFWANLVFISTAVVIGTATFWPLIWPVIRNVMSIPDASFTLTRIFYDRLISGVGILLAFLVGLAALANLRGRRSILLPLLGCSIGLACFTLVYKSGEKQLLPALAYGACAFSFIPVLTQLLSNLKARIKISSSIAHLGLLLLVVTAGFSSKEQAIRGLLNTAGRITIGKYEFIYDSFVHKSFEDVVKVGPEIVVRKITKKGFVEKLWPRKSNSNSQSSVQVAVLWPHNNLYSNGQTSSEVAVHTRLFEDIYVSFDGVGQDSRVLITAKVKPLMLWLWVSALLIVAGFVLALLEGKRSVERKPKTVKP